jgi:Beta-propeller repeat
MFSMDKLLEKAKTGSIRKWPVGLLAAALVVSVSAAPNSSKTGEKKSPSAPAAQASPVAKLKSSMLEMPLAFEANRGQTDATVKFLTRAQNFTVFLMPTETVMRGRNDDVLRMQLRNANQSPKLVGENKQPKVTNYYIGNDRSKWLESVPNFGQVRYQDVYTGIDMVYHSDQRQLEYDFVVKPGADPNQIQVAFNGAAGVTLTAKGELELTSTAGTSLHHKPVVYQMIAGKRQLVHGEYALANNLVGFKIGEYDRNEPLIIDPSLQILSFFGGVLNDEAAGIATSAVPQGAAVVFVGRSQSPSLPHSGAKPGSTLDWDGFATGLNPGGTAILWTTYIGGSADDAVRGVAMDNRGSVYIVGYTNSPNFPAGSPVNYDAFVAKLGAGSGGLAASTLYGGFLVDQGTSIALDYSTFSKLASPTSILNPATDPNVIPNVVIGGLTNGAIGQAGSPAGMVGKTPDGNQKTFNNCTATVNTGGCGTTDGFVAIFDNTLALLHHTYFGGGGNDQVNGVAVDIWGNIYATGFATPNIAPNFPVTRGIAQTTQRAGCGTTNATGCWDAALNPQNSATAFVAKFACTTGTPAIGVPSPPFGGGSQFPVCGGGNTLNTLANSALFGGSAAGSTFINPQQTVLGQNGVTEAGFAIAVDQNGWGQEGVAGVTKGFLNAAGFPDIVPTSESNGACNLGAQGNNGLGAPRCAVSASNTATTGGFEPGLSGPHVYVVGATASRDFVNGLVFNASCAVPPLVSSTVVPSLCPTPYVFGAAVTLAGTLPSAPFCDPMGIANCPNGVPVPEQADLRIKAVANGTNSGQTQGWLASFQFPAVTQAVVTPPLATQTTITTLNPPTIPNYIILQPATCPSTGSGAAACVEGGINAATFANATSPAANFGCTNTGAGVNCPTAFLGSFNGVAVDSDEQVYLIGQIGMSPFTLNAVTTPGVFGTGAPNRLALEIQRISPYANTGPNSFLQPNFCPVSAANAPCAFPLENFPSSSSFGTDFVLDSLTPGTGILNSSFGQILPGAPPFPNPNQPGGVGSGIAVNATREAFFVGTTTVTSPVAAAPVQAIATVTVTAGLVAITVTNPGSGYANPPALPPTVTLNGVSGCTTNPAFTTTVAAGNVSITVTNAGAGCTGVSPTVTIAPPPPGGGTVDTSASFSISTNTIILCPLAPCGVGPGFPAPFQGNLGSTGAQNAATGNPGSGPEDVIYGALQFFDAIATPTVVNFTATVNSFSSITGPNGQTGANAKAIVSYSDWQGQLLNIPPGCVVTPIVPGGQNGVPAFVVTPVNGAPNQFQVTVNSTAATQTADTVSFPGVVTSLVTFTKLGPCTGVGQPTLESWDPLTLTLTVSAPLNLTAESTFQVHSAGGLVTEYVNSGQQLVAGQIVNTGIDVTTASSNGPINFTAQIVPGQNWGGGVTGAVIVPTPTDIIYTAVGPNLGTPTRVPVQVNTAVLANLQPGTYTAFIMFTASPETPDLPTSGSTSCGTATVPVASGTTSPACIPIVITIGGVPTANIVTLNFGGSPTPQQTHVPISNPTTSTYTFTAAYQATPVFGTALPAANVFFVGTASTLVPATIGNTVGGTVPAGGLFELPIQINPAGLPTGVYTGQILLNAIGQAPTSQTTVPIIVYVGPHTGEDTPSGNGLGLMLPTNVIPVGTGALPGAAPGSPGSYALSLSVPSGTGPTGINQIPNPTLIQITGLNNTATTAFAVNAPTVSSSLAGVSITNVGQAFAGTPSACGSTFGSNNPFPDSPLGPPCVWDIWVDATSLNSTNTTAMAACAGGLGETGTLTFSPTGGSFPFANLVVPLTVCVTDQPSLTLGMPNTFPNPTFGPTNGTGFGTLLAQPGNLVPGFPQSIVEMVLATSGGGNIGATAAPINLLTLAGNSSQVCKILDIHTNGGVVPFVTISPLGVQFATIQPLSAVLGGALFLGPPNAPNSLAFNSGAVFANGLGILGLSASAISPYSGGPVTITPAMQTFAICVNNDSIGNGTGTFSTTVTINGGGVGPITIPVNMVVSNGTTTGPLPPAKFSQIGIYRPSTPVGAAPGFFTVDENGNNIFDLPGDRIVNFGEAGDIPVAGDWDGSGVIRIGVYRPSNGHWYLDMNDNGKWDGSGPGLDLDIQFGAPSATCVPSSAPGLAACQDLPVVGDWNGNGVSKLGIFRGGIGSFFLDNQNPTAAGPHTSFTTDVFGEPGDIPIASNWNATGPADQIGVYRRGTWYVNATGDGVYHPTDPVYTFGSPGDIPVVGNWNGTGAKRIGVFNSFGSWYLDINGDHVFTTGIDSIFAYGEMGDLPVVGAWTLP